MDWESNFYSLIHFTINLRNVPLVRKLPIMYYRLITFVFSPIKCPCVRHEAVSLSLIQLQGKESNNDDRAEEVASASTSLTHFQPLYLQKAQINGELNSGKQSFL